MIEILGKKYVKDLLLIIGEYEDGIFFSDLSEELGNIVAEKLHQSAVSRALTLMIDENLIIREDIFDTNRRLPKTFYKITELGKMGIELIKKDEEIEKMKPKFHNEIKGNVGQVINIDKAEGLEINFKKGK